MLIKFLAAYASKGSVRKDYARDPRRTLRAHDVTDDHLKLIAKVGLEEAASQEIRKMITGSDTEGVTQFGWGVEAMFVEKFEPHSTGDRTPFKLVVTGKDFTKDTRIAVTRFREGDDEEFDEKKFPFFDARRMELVTSKKLIGTMPPLAAGTYTVAVYRTFRNLRLGAYATEPLIVDGHGHGPGHDLPYPTRGETRKVRGAKAKGASAQKKGASAQKKGASAKNKARK